jgi:probable HAF family extracellular repeat protein
VFPQCNPPDPQTPCAGWAQAISPNSKYIAGISWFAERSQYATLWIDGAVVGNYGGYNVYATHVNDSGVIVGYFDTGLPPVGPIHAVYRAFRWEAGTKTDLGSLPGSTPDHALASGPSGINSSGSIVGWSELPGYVYHGVLWKDGQIIDLNTTLLPSQLPAGMAVTSAEGINDKGDIPVAASNTATGAEAWYIAHPAIPTHTRISSNLNPSTYGQQLRTARRVSGYSVMDSQSPCTRDGPL